MNTAAKFRVLQKKEVSSTAEPLQIFRFFGGFVWLAIQSVSHSVSRSDATDTTPPDSQE